MGFEVIQGDCLEVMRGMVDCSVDAVVTDPPYGIDYQSGGKPLGSQTRSAGHVPWEPIAGDKSVDGRWLPEAFRVLREGSALYLCTRWDVEPEWRAALTAAGFTVKQRLTWHRRVHGKGDIQGTYATTCEDVLFATKGRHILNSRPSMLLDVGCVPTWERRYHPHQKPVALPVLLMCASTRPGATILDPFCGSGTTGVACVQTGCDFIGVEREASYVAIARQRIDEALRQVSLLETPAQKEERQPLITTASLFSQTGEFRLPMSADGVTKGDSGSIAPSAGVVQ